MAITEHKTSWDRIMLVLALGLLYDDFKITIVYFFYLDNKDLEEIQLIIISIEMVNLEKQITGIMENLAMIAKNKRPEQ